MVGIIILNYNNARLTLSCVESVQKWNTFPARIAVVDNASTDDSLAVFRDYQHQHSSAFELLVSEQNGGYAQGNNIGLKFFEADEDVTEVMILNNDILFTEDIIPQLSAYIGSHEESGLVSPLLRRRDGKTIDQSCARKDCEFAEIIWSFILYFTDIAGIISHYRKKSKIPIDTQKDAIGIELPSGSCMMIRKALFKEIGYFDPNTFLYFEENILYRKLKAQGKTNYLLPGISCIHLGGETTNKVSHPAEYMKKSKRSAYYYAKNYRVRNFLQRLLLEMSYAIFRAEVVLVKTIKKWAC